MADTIREKIINNIVGNLQQIKIINDYNTDIGLQVFRGESFINTSILSACFVIPEQDEKEEQQEYGADRLIMPVSIIGIAKYTYSTSKTTESDNISKLGEKILGDIRLSMGLCVDYTDEIIYVSGGIQDYPDSRQGEISVQVNCTYQIKYKTLKNNPYEIVKY